MTLAADDRTAIAADPAPDAQDRARPRRSPTCVGCRTPEGWWKGELETNVTMDAEDLLLREFLGIRTDAGDRRGGPLDPLAAARRTAPGPPSTAARATCPPPSRRGSRCGWPATPPTRRTWRGAAEFVRGARRHRAPPGCSPGSGWRCSGCGPGTSCPTLPPELIFLPQWFPLNVYDWGCWARQTDRAADGRRARCGRCARCRSASTSCAPGARRPPTQPLRTLGRVLPAARPGAARLRPAPGAAAAPAARCAARPSGSSPARRPTGRGAASSRRGSTRCSRCTCSATRSTTRRVRAGLAGPRRLHRPRGDAGRRRCAGSRPASRRSGTPASRSPRCSTPASPADDPAVRRAARLAARRGDHACRGDWAVRRPRARARRLGLRVRQRRLPRHRRHRRGRARAAPGRAPGPAGCGPRSTAAWPGWPACSPRDGGWGAFDADNTRTLPNKLPFCDFGAVIDPPSADVTAHVVEMLAAEGLADTDGRAGAASRGCSTHQEPDGSWFGRWGANYVYGTGAVVPALVAAGVDPRPTRRSARAVRWLRRRTRTPTAAGARTCAPTTTRRGSAAATSTASQTAWALLALLAAGERGRAVERGVALAGRAPSAPTARWDEPQFTGTGFPGDFYINYHLYRLVFPICGARPLPAGRRRHEPSRSVVHPAARRARRGARGRRGAASGVVRTGMGPAGARAAAAAARRAGAGPVAGRRRRRRARPGTCAPATWWSPSEVRGGRTRRSPCPSAPLLAGGAAPRRADRPRRPARATDRRGRRGADARAGSPRPARWPSTWRPRRSPRLPAAGRSPSVRVDRRHRRRAAAAARHAWRAASPRCARCAARAPALARVGGRGRRRARSCSPARGRSAPGVERAIDIVERALDRYGAPVYVRRQIVHNAHVVARPRAARRGLRRGGRRGAGRRACSCFAAHGVAPAVRAEAADRGARASSTPPARWWPRCTARSAATPAADDTVFLIGHADHEEVEGTVGEAPDRRRRGRRRRARPRRSAAPTPTRVAYVDADDARRRRGRARSPASCASGSRRCARRARDDICYATTNRQQAVRAIAARLRPRARRRLAQLLELAAPGRGGRARGRRRPYLVDDAGEVDLRWLRRRAPDRRHRRRVRPAAPGRRARRTACPASARSTVRETRPSTEDVRFTLPKEVS